MVKLGAIPYEAIRMMVLTMYNSWWNFPLQRFHHVNVVRRGFTVQTLN